MALSESRRFEVFARDDFTCQYCGRHAPDVVLEVDHIKPVSGGGKDNEANLLTACYDCNRGKGDKRVALLHRTWGHLPGKFFHKLDETGYAQWQGVVLAGVGDGYYMVELHEWLTGSASHSAHRLVHIREFSRNQQYIFYSSGEEMSDAYKYGGLKRPSMRAG